MNDLFSLRNKTVLITGGATHLGKALSEGICQYGGKVIIGSRNQARNEQFARELNQKYASTCVGAYLDFTEDASIDALLEQLSSVDVLINNAAYSVPGALHEQDAAEFMQGLTGTIGGTFQITRKVLLRMMQQGYGNIINIASMYGVVSPDPSAYEGTANSPNPANYGCGKAAVIQFTKYIACNYASFGIRANAIVPGAFPNPDVQKDIEFIQRLKDKTPLKRIGVPEDLKGIVVLLASDASSYMNGQAICVDGGWTAW